MTTTLVVLICASLLLNMIQFVILIPSEKKVQKSIDDKVRERVAYLTSQQESDYQRNDKRYAERENQINYQIAALEAKKEILKGTFDIQNEHWKAQMAAKNDEIARQTSTINNLIANQPKQIVGIPVPQR